MLLIVSASAATSPFASTVSFWRRFPLATAVTTFTMPRTWSVRFAAMKLTLSVRSFHVPPTPGHLRLAAELAFRAHFARHARHFRRKGVELVHHRVDRVFQFENFTFHVHRDLARKIAARHRRRHFGDVADLRREVGAHRVHRVRQVFPRAGHAGHHRLHAQACLPCRLRAPRASLPTRNDRNCSTIVLIVSLSCKNFTAHVHRNFARQVAVGHGDRHFRDVAHLSREV